MYSLGPSYCAVAIEVALVCALIVFFVSVQESSKDSQQTTVTVLIETAETGCSAEACVFSLKKPDP